MRSLVNTPASPNVSGLLEMVGINHIVVRGIGVAEHRKTLRMLGPRKPAAIHNCATQRCPVAAHELGQRMHHDIGAVFNGP